MVESRMSAFSFIQFPAKYPAIFALSRAVVDLPIHWFYYVFVRQSVKSRHVLPLAESITVFDEPITSGLLFPVHFKSFSTCGDWGTVHEEGIL